jgi:hypothetical protein
MTIFEKLDAVKTMPELDALRPECARAMTDAAKERGEAGFHEVQDAFIRAKNRLRRVPLRDRSW